MAVLPGGAEVCLNGAAFSARDILGGTPFDFHSAVQPFQGLVSTGTVRALGANESYRFEVPYPEGRYALGEPVFIKVESTCCGDSFLTTVQNCRFLRDGEFDSASSWTLAGAAERLDSAEFPHDSSSPIGSFLLLTTNHPASPVAVGDLDGNGEVDYDASAATQTFRPVYPCQLGAVLGFYSSEDPNAFGLDDFAGFEVVQNASTTAIEFSVPDVTGSTFADFDPFDGIERSVVSSGATNGSSFSMGGATGSFALVPPVAAGQDATVAFAVADQFAADLDSGLLVDEVECRSLLIFAATFEMANAYEWDERVGWTP